MKNIILTLLVAMIALNVSAQDKNTTSGDNTSQVEPAVKQLLSPAVYITTSTGINNNTGLLGFSFDVPVSSNVVIDGGVGASTWNSKVYAGVKYYLKPHQRGFAFGTGLTYCTGLYDDKHTLQTIYGANEPIEYNKNPQTNILFAAYRYWTLGRKYNRFYLELGWSVPLTGGDKITQLNGYPITANTRSNLAFWAPGGLILAAGFSFGVH